MLYAIAVAPRGLVNFVAVSHVDQLPGVVIKIETDLGRRMAKRIARNLARTEEAIQKPQVLAVRLISRVGCQN